MRQGILLLNLLLVAGVGLLGQRLISDWRHFQESTRQEVYQRINRSPAQPEEESFGQESTRPFNHYLEIDERNLFTPERRPEQDPVGTAVTPRKPPPLPIKPTLHGVSTIRGEQRAFLTVFRGKKNQGESSTVTLGDMVQGYRVGEITPTTVTLVWNDHTVLIDIMDSKKGKQPKKSAKQAGAGAVNIVTVGSTRAAVETVAAAIPPAEEAGRALTGTAGAGQQRIRPGAAARGRTGIAGRQGTARGRTGTTARRPVYGSAATTRR